MWGVNKMKRKSEKCYIMRKPSTEYLGEFEYIPVDYKGEQVANEAFSYEEAENNASNEGYDHIDTWQKVIVKQPKPVI